MTKKAFGTTLLVSGAERLLSDRVVAERKQLALAEQPEADVNRIDAAQLGESMLSEVVGGSLFASHVIAVIDDVGATPAELFEQLVEVAKAPGAELCLILVHAGGNKGKGLIDKLKRAKVPTESVAAPKPWELPRFCQQEAKQQGIRMDAETAGALVAAVGTDLRSLAGAISQLAADADGAAVNVELVQRYFSGRAEVTSFAVSDAVLEGNPSLALERLRWALGTGVAPVLVTSAMAGAFRGMGKYLDARGELATDPGAARRLGIPAWKLKDYRRMSSNWRQGAVSQAIGLIATADAQVKGAATDPAYALERMLLGVLALRQC